MSESIEKLKEAFAGESQANRRYLAYAKKADDEGLPQIAKLFWAAAHAETVHALNHLRIAGEVGMTVSNLDEAVSGETFEYTKMYPPYIDTAKKEGNKQAEWSFNIANQVEEIHHGLFQAALKDVDASETMKDEPYFVCQGCGNTVEGEAPETCPICGAPKSAFKRVD